MTYINLPLQSGSSKILKLMGRRYTKEQYLELINTTWELGKLVKIYQDAYDIMVA